MYNLFQFLHVASAIVWVGSGVGLVALLTTMNRAGDRATLMATNRHMEVLGGRLFGPSAMATLLFGVVTVLVGDGLSFTDPWIVIGFAGVAVSLLIVVISNPINRKIGEAVAAHGPDHPDVTAGLTKARVLNYVDLVVLFVVVWAMVAKPGA